MAEPAKSTAHTVPAEVWRARFRMTDEQVREFCAKSRIAELALFGSILRDDWNAESDIDLLVEFAPGVHWPWGGFVPMSDELEALLGRRVDLTELQAVRESTLSEPREAVLESSRRLYAA